MKDFIAFLKKYRSTIQACSILVFSILVLVLTFVYLSDDSMNPAIIFFSIAMLMVTIFVQYFSQKKKKKNILVFYGLAAIVCVIFGFVYLLMPPV